MFNKLVNVTFLHHLIFSTLGALIDHAGIRHVRAQEEVHTPAGSASDGGLDDWRLDAKYDWGLNVLALQLPAHGVPERMRVCVFLWGLGKNFMVIELECSASCCAVPALTLLESAGMVATVSKAIAFRVDILKTQLRSSFSLYTHTKKDIYRISINFLFSFICN